MTTQPTLRISRTTLLTGWRLNAARFLWFTLVGASALIALVAWPLYHQTLQTICERPVCLDGQELSSEGAAALQDLGISMPFYALYVNALSILNRIGLIAIGAVMFWRAGHQWSVWVISLGFVLQALVRSFAVEYFSRADTEWRYAADVLQGLGFWLTCVIIITFPDGRFVPRWMVVAAALTGLWWVGLGPLFPPLNPDAWSLTDAAVFNLIAYGCATLIAFYRYRSVNSALERQQVHWTVYGAGVALVIGTLYGLTLILSMLAFGRYSGALALVQFLTLPLYHLAILCIPLGLMAGVLRYRLYDLNLMINRTLVQGLFSLILISLFFGLSLLLQPPLRAVTNSEQPLLSSMLSIVLVIVVFEPLRARLRHLIDTQVYGLRYDLDQFAKPVPRNVGALTGMRVGAYELLEPLGRGGMGEVYKAWHIEQAYPVAVKMMLDSAEPEAVERFQREAAVVMEIKHPNIIKVHDFIALERKSYLVMDYLEGQDLAAVLRTRQMLSLQEALGILKDVGAGLDYAHQRGVIHRDVKPSNIMLTTDRAVLMDFGIARSLSERGITHSRHFLGTVQYTAPEQIKSSHDVGPAADLYALGVVAYQMLTGSLPFDDSNAGVVVFAHLQHPPPDPQRLNHSLPTSVALALLRMLSKAPEARFPSAAVFVQALRGG